jgi:hypothetical protein
MNNLPQDDECMYCLNCSNTICPGDICYTIDDELNPGLLDGEDVEGMGAIFCSRDCKDSFINISQW